MRGFYIFTLFFLSFSVLSQTDFKHQSFQIKKKKTVDPKEAENGFAPHIINLEAPKPRGSSFRSFLNQQKEKSKQYFKNHPYTSTKDGVQKTAQQPSVGFELRPKRILANGMEVDLFAGIPSDNTVAINNNGVALMGMNVLLYAHDMVEDTFLFEDQFIYLRAFVDGSSISNYYDPKVIYDPVEDRFIVVLLKDNTPDDSELFVCFSSSSDVNDPWNVYTLPGNPLINNRWTDFPAISITEDKMYFTANLIVPNVSWQVGFDGSLIWELDKNKGFEGAASIDAELYHSVSYNGAFTRNLHAVQGADGWADEAYFLSNRNFDIQNDTVFLIHVDEGNVDVQAVISNVPYGVPPNARQQDTDTSDASEGLQTNDARVLGALLFDDEIHFVGNTIYPPTGFSAIYHGVMTNVSDNPQIDGHIIYDEVKDYGYPNIAWVGNEECDIETIIGFNSSSFTDFPSIEAVYYNNQGEYSDPLLIKEGLNYVDRLSGGYERWGDYFGLQRIYNQPGKAISFGYLALENNSNSGYLAELISPDSSRLQIDFEVNYQQLCDNQVELNITQGVPPYTVFWEGDTLGTAELTRSGYCAKDTVSVVVLDQRGCMTPGDFVINERSENFNVNVFPNPADDLLGFKFNLEEDMDVTAEIYDMSGKKIKEVSTLPAKVGLNEYVFSIAPLSPGTYHLVLSGNDSIIDKFRFIKGR